MTGAGFAFPADSFGPRNAYFGPNFLVGPASQALEPGHFALLLPTSAAALLLRRRRA